MLCTRCGGDSVPDWVACPLCGAEASEFRPAPVASVAPRPGRGRRGDRVAAAALVAGAALCTVGAAQAPLLRDDWNSTLFYSAWSPIPLTIAAVLLWFGRTAPTGAGISAGHLGIAYLPSALPASLT